MIPLRIVVATALLALSTAVYAADQAVRAFQCKPGTVRYHANGSLSEGKLRAPEKLSGYPCRGWVLLHPDGTLKQLELSEPLLVQGMALPKGSIVLLHEDGILDQCFLAANMTVQKLPCKGGKKIATVFHRNGLVASCVLSKTTEIQGIPCAAGANTPVSFHENGRLKSCVPAKSVEIGGVSYKRGAKIILDADGNAIPEGAGISDPKDPTVRAE